MYKKRRTKKRYILIVGLFLIAGIGLLYVVFKSNSKPTQQPQDVQQSNPSQVTTNQKQPFTTLIAAGDFIAHDALNNDAKSSGTYNYTKYMQQMKPILQKASINFCNQATLIGGEAFGITGYPLFNAPFAFMDAMTDVGCNVINTASNHSSDKSQAVINSNVEAWQKKSSLAVSGQNTSQQQKQSIAYFTTDSVKYAFLTYTTYTNQTPPTAYSVNMYSRDFALQQINEAKAAGAKFIIVSMRWGTEYSQSVNAYQKAEAQFLTDIGVQLILGHGPHVLEPVQWLTGKSGNKTLVWYSLGNFLHAQLEPETLFNGVAVIKIDPATAEIVSNQFLPTYMHYDWTAEEAARQDLLARRNFALVPLDQAQPLFAKSQLKTTISAQKERLQKTLNTLTTVQMIQPSDL